MNDQAIVDAHHHLWDREDSHYPWLEMDPPPQLVCGDISPISGTYGIDRFLADVGDLPVAKSVHVQADRDDPVAETAWLQSLADMHGFPHGIVASAQLDQPDLEDALARQTAFPNVRGIRQILSAHSDPVLNQTDRPDYLRDPAWRRGFAQLARHGLLFDLQIYPGQVDDAASLLLEHPDVEVVVEHALMPAERHEGAFEYWRAALRTLAQFPQTTIKISGLGMADHTWTVESIRPYVHEVIDAFGTGRCMFGSNFPIDRLYSDYATVWRAFAVLTTGLSAGERADLFCDTATRAYRL